MTVIGYKYYIHEVYYGAAAFYALSVCGFTATLGPVINETNTDERKRLYARAMHGSISTLTKCICYLCGEFLILMDFSYLVLMFVPFWATSFIMMTRKIKFVDT